MKLVDNGFHFKGRFIKGLYCRACKALFDCPTPEDNFFLQVTGTRQSFYDNYDRTEFFQHWCKVHADQIEVRKELIKTIEGER